MIVVGQRQTDTRVEGCQSRIYKHQYRSYD